MIDTADSRDEFRHTKGGGTLLSAAKSGVGMHPRYRLQINAMFIRLEVRSKHTFTFRILQFRQPFRDRL